MLRRRWATPLRRPPATVWKICSTICARAAARPPTKSSQLLFRANRCARESGRLAVAGRERDADLSFLTYIDHELWHVNRDSGEALHSRAWGRKQRRSRRHFVPDPADEQVSLLRLPCAGCSGHRPNIVIRSEVATLKGVAGECLSLRSCGRWAKWSRVAAPRCPVFEVGMISMAVRFDSQQPPRSAAIERCESVGDVELLTVACRGTAVAGAGAGNRRGAVHCGRARRWWTHAPHPRDLRRLYPSGTFGRASSRSAAG